MEARKIKHAVVIHFCNAIHYY